MGKKLFSSISLLILVFSSVSPVFARSIVPTGLQAELDGMADDELIIKYKIKPALKNKIINKYKSLYSAHSKIAPEMTKQALSSIVDYYNLPIDEASPENNGYSRLASSAVYQNSPLSEHLRLAATDGSATTLLKLRGIHKLKLARLIAKMNAEKRSTSDYEVLAVYPNYLYQVTDIPNDPEYAVQKSLSQINVDKAWAKSQGEAVVVAVIDTGVDYEHKDLVNNIWSNSDEIANNGKDDDHNGYIDDTRGWDFVKKAGSSCLMGEDCGGRDNEPSDYNGHGTHVSGIIAAEQNNEFGISGVAPKAKIMPLRAAYSVGSSAYLKSSDVAEAVEYAIRNGADVINMSFAGSKLGILEDVVKRAQELGVVMVAAAGNSDSDIETFPAALDDVIAVGSVNEDGERSSFSNYGDWVDIMAPGARILSTAPDDGFAYKSGTSMSAPFVAGVAALVISKSKELKLSPQQVLERIISSSSSTASALVTQSQLSQLNADVNYPLQVDTMNVPRIAGLNQSVEFIGSGSEDNEEAAEYEWSSNKDGVLSTSAEFETDVLSAGDHNISLKVRGKSGDWSDPVSKTITIDSVTRVFTQSAEDVTARIVRHNGELIASMPITNRGYVEEYIWTSSKDGELKSHTRTFPITELSPGLHHLTLIVHDKRGFFSEPIERVVEIKS